MDLSRFGHLGDLRSSQACCKQGLGKTLVTCTFGPCAICSLAIHFFVQLPIDWGSASVHVCLRFTIFCPSKLDREAMSNKNTINSMHNTGGLKTVIDLDQIWGDLNCGIRQVYNRENMSKKRWVMATIHPSTQCSAALLQVYGALHSRVQLLHFGASAEQWERGLELHHEEQAKPSGGRRSASGHGTLQEVEGLFEVLPD